LRVSATERNARSAVCWNCMPISLPEGSVTRPAPVGNIAGSRPKNPLHDFHGRGLAGAVGAQQAETDPLSNGKADAVNRLELAVLLDQMPDFQDRLTICAHVSVQRRIL
jgi:hypothetical protein